MRRGIHLGVERRRLHSGIQSTFCGGSEAEAENGYGENAVDHSETTERGL